MYRILLLRVASLLSAFTLCVATADGRTVQTVAGPLNPLLNPVPCDTGTPTVNHELGGGPSSGGPFLALDDIAWNSATATTGASACARSDVATTPNTLITITNNSGRYWDNLWFVADGEVIFHPVTGANLPVLTNADLELMEIAPLGGGAFGLAFRIDNLGINQPLVSESLNADLIFDPNESWTFIVQDWAALSGVTGGCGSTVGSASFGSFGVGGISCNSVGSNASIVARLRPIPEPDTALVFLIGLAGLSFACRKKAA